MPTLLVAPTPAQEAIDFLKSKPIVSREVFDGLLPELKGLAFTVTGIAEHDQLQAIRDTIAELPAGRPWKEVKAKVAGALEPYFVDPDADAETQASQAAGARRRAELLLRYHGQQAYSIGAYEVQTRQRARLPFWLYRTMEDSRVRDSHAALNGLILPADDPFWSGHYPPWDWGCRCLVIAVTKAQAEQVRKADQARPADERLLIEEGPRLQKMREGQLIRDGQARNISTPAQRGGSYSFEPALIKPDLSRIQARYDAETWAHFRSWAEQTKLGGPDSQSVWQWLGGDAWPADPLRLQVVRKLGGATGAELVRDASTGSLYVRKRGANPGQVAEEAAADAAYAAMGVPVPETKLYAAEAAGGAPLKLSRFMEGAVPLRDALKALEPTGRVALLRKVQEHAAADMLLANWDVAGNWSMDSSFDNILVKDGVPYRIDNGGALRHSGLGQVNPEKLGPYPIELWTTRDRKLNPSTAQIYEGLGIARLAEQIEQLLPQRQAILEALPTALRPVVDQRLTEMARIAKQALDAMHHGFKETYADELAKHVMGLRAAGVTAALPKELRQAPGDTTAVDENGVPFDHLRTQKPKTSAPAAGPADPFGKAIVDAAKTINHHLGKGDVAFNASKISAALALEEKIAKLAKSKGKTNPEAIEQAKHYKPALDAIKAAVEAAKAGQVPKPIPNVATWKAAPVGAQPAPAGPPPSIVTRWADYAKTQGLAAVAHLPAAWMGAHAGDSWSPGARLYKEYIRRQRTAPLESYWMQGNKSYPTTAAKMAKEYDTWVAAQPGGEAAVHSIFASWHALTQEALAHIAFRGNDRGRATVRIIRTETASAVLKPGGVTKGGQAVELKRGPNESGSIFAPYMLYGDSVTIQAVPHVQITTLYFFERSPGAGGGALLGNNENEFTFIGQGIPARWLQGIDLAIGEDATAWDVPLPSPRPIRTPRRRSRS